MLFEREGIELQITKTQAHKGYHSGSCDEDIAELRAIPKIKKQLDNLDADVVSKYLSEFGAWGEEELKDHNENLDRLLWLACADIVEGD